MITALAFFVVTIIWSYFREEIFQLLSDTDSELHGKVLSTSSVFPSSRQGRTLFGGNGGEDEADMMVGLRSRALLEAAKRPEEVIMITDEDYNNVKPNQEVDDGHFFSW